MATLKDYGTFLRLWIGQSVSGLGSQLTGFGLAVWVFQKTHSVGMMAMIYMATAVPGILLSPFLGALVDRINRKKMLLFSDCFAGVFSLFLAVILTTGTLQLWEVYLVAGAGSIATTIMWPTMSATTSLLVPKEQFGRATGLLQFGDAGSVILAPILGGFIYGYLGLKGLLFADVFSFLFAITMTLLCHIPQPEDTAEGVKARQSFWSEASFGFHFVFARTGLMILLFYFMFINLVLPISTTLIAPIILSHWDARTLGFVQSMAGVGMLVGTAIIAAWGGPKKKIYGLPIFGIVTFVASLLMLLPLNIATMSACFFIIMVSSPIVNACSQVIWQRKTPADVQGKVFAVRRMFAWFMTPLAYGIAGPLADRVFEPNHHPAEWLQRFSHGLVSSEPGAGLRSMFVVSAILTLIASLAVFLLPRFRHLEEELPDAELKAKPEAAPEPILTTA
ncbi:MAG TPA: MFS transporter [Fimbriimonadaceae bacterium]|nr:MFS transporter [Fimbriimonadaceae bacterium]